VSEPVVQQENARSLHDEDRRYVWPHEVIKGFALEVAQLLFYEGNPLGNLVWSPEEEKTQITICDKYAFNLARVGTTPAIVANRGPMQWSRTSGFRQMQSLDLRTDRRTYTDLVAGSMVLSCFSRSGAEAELIAGYLFESFQALRDVLRKLASRGIMQASHLGFFKIEATQMGEEALVKGGARPEISVVPVAFQARVQRRWSVEPQGDQKLRTVVTRISTP
jgi:hypothetical protein